jgi:hypothetical protein
MKEEFSDLRRHELLSGPLAVEVNALRHMSCDCGVPARHLRNHRYFCHVCVMVYDSKARKQRMDEFATR